LYKKNPNSAENKFVYDLISFLSSNKSEGNKNRIFYISTVTLSEILSNEDEADKIQKIVNVLNSNDVEFISFDQDIAKDFSNYLKPYLERKKIHEFAIQAGWKQHELMLAREWVTKDKMIIMSGLNRNVDAILTLDKNTFLPFCEKIEAPCAICYEEHFHRSESGSNFFEYIKR
jgi:hypothetical protein